MIVKSSHLAAVAIGLAIGGFAFGCMHSSEHAQANSAPAAAAPAPAAAAPAAQVDAARLVGADKEPGNWMSMAGPIANSVSARSTKSTRITSRTSA